MDRLDVADRLDVVDCLDEVDCLDVVDVATGKLGVNGEKCLCNVYYKADSNSSSCIIYTSSPNTVYFMRLKLQCTSMFLFSLYTIL